MQKLRVFLHIIDVTSEWTGKIVSFTIVLVIGAIIWWVVSRYVFHLNSMWNYVTVTKFFLIYATLGAAYVLRLQAHVNVDILHGRLPLRVRSIVDLATSILFFFFCITLLWMAVEVAVEEAQHLPPSPKIFLPANWPVTLLAPVGIFLLLLQGSAKFIRDLIIAITGKEAA